MEIRSSLARLTGLAALFGMASLSTATVPTEYRHANATGRRRVNRGEYTRNRKSRGMNPKKRKRMELRRIDRELEKRWASPPMGQYLAYAVAPPIAGKRKQAVLAGPIELGPVAPVERAREHFERHLPDDQPFEIKLRRPSC